MAIGSLSGRSTHGPGHGRRTVLSHRPSTSLRQKTKSNVKADADTEHPSASRPDIDELRKKRLGYYSLPASERRRETTSSWLLAKPKTRTTTSTSTGKAASSEQKRRRRRHRSGSDKAGKKVTTERGGSQELVYGLSERAAGPNDSVRLRSSSSDKRSKHISSTTRRELPVVVEDELTPEDSISQVGLAKSPERRKTTSSGTSLKRSSTTPAKLLTIKEGETEARVATPVSRKSSKRDSTPSLLGLWRRNSVASGPPQPRLVECLTCAADDVPSTQSAKLACGHRMCHDCLKRVFEMSVKDPAHMPPKCCTHDHIPLKHVDSLFDLKFKMLWNRKYQEYSTKNRIYCPNSRCSEWIKPKHFHSSGGRKYAQCPRCTTKVCTLCNGKMHKARECPKDPEIAKLVEQAKEKGWQSCYSCHAMVELKEGKIISDSAQTIVSMC